MTIRFPFISISEIRKKKFIDVERTCISKGTSERGN